MLTNIEEVVFFPYEGFEITIFGKLNHGEVGSWCHPEIQPSFDLYRYETNDPEYLEIYKQDFPKFTEHLSDFALEELTNK